MSKSVALGLTPGPSTSRLYDCNDNLRRKRHQFHRMSAANVDTARGPADVKARIAAVGPAQFRQPLDESGELSPPPRIALVRTQEHADPPHRAGLLRATCKRP